MFNCAHETNDRCGILGDSEKIYEIHRIGNKVDINKEKGRCLTDWGTGSKMLLRRVKRSPNIVPKTLK